MDDFWAVVWGASIALVASVIGGFMTSVLGPWLARRADEKQSEGAQIAEKREVLRQALWDAMIAVRAYATHPWEDQDQQLANMDALDVPLLRIRLWTDHDERAVADSLQEVAAQTEQDEALNLAPAWEEVAVRWFRGELRSEHFAAEFKRVGDVRRTWRNAEKLNGESTPTPTPGDEATS